LGTVTYVLAHGEIVYWVAWSPEGSQVATASGDHTAKTWDPSSGELIFELEHDASVLSVAWSPDAALLATGAFDGRVRIWSADSGELQATIVGSGGSAYSVGWSPEGDRLAFGSGTSVEIWTRCAESAVR